MLVRNKFSSSYDYFISLFLFFTILHLHYTGAAIEPVCHLIEQPNGDSDYGSDYDSSNDDAEEAFDRLAKY